MATGRNFIGFNVDTTAGHALAGALQEMEVSMKTPAHIGPALKYAHAELSNHFTAHMAAVAPTRPSAFHHVYEWNRIGDPTAKLWRDVLRGGGNNRVATFEWRASKSIVPVRDPLPVPQSLAGNPYGDPDNLPKQIHVFVWKAPVMEYGHDLNIAPKRGKFIVYFTGPTSNPDDEMYQTLRFSTEPITVHNPGGTQVKGAFTREYVDWWSHGGAQSVFQTTLNRVFQMKVKELASKGLASATSRARNRNFGMQTHGNANSAIAAGKAAMRAAIGDVSRDYIEMAKAREGFMSDG